MQAIEVELRHVGCDGAYELVLAHQGIHSQGSVEQFIIACHLGMHATVLDICQCRHSRQMIAPKLQLLYLGIGLQHRTGGKEIGAAEMV